MFFPYLEDTLELCSRQCERAGIQFCGELRRVDFIKDAASRLAPQSLFGPYNDAQVFTHAILNPPYKKIHSRSDVRENLRRIGVETGNLYTGFLAAAACLLEPGAELIAITPRSFCNGPYFRPFRKFFLREMSLKRLHLFESRQEAFRDDEVLQETVILRAVKGVHRDFVNVTTSAGPQDEFSLERTIEYKEVVRPDDPEAFIWIVPDTLGQWISERMARFTATLDDIGLTVSTGRVVDFRAASFLCTVPEEGTAPLLYPINLSGGGIQWPVLGRRKPQAIRLMKGTELLTVPRGHYVLVKRFSSKEERRRIIASVCDPKDLPGESFGFENHLNYFHEGGRGMDAVVAAGLSVYLNSTLLDAYFRQFNGHTQVNATDLRSLRYPTRAQLAALGMRVAGTYPEQEEIDRLIEDLVREDYSCMADEEKNSGDDPVAAKRKIDEALEVLTALGFPRPQINERSALTLLALLDLGPTTPWSDAQQPLRGVTPVMKFMETRYGKKYAPNTRETVRRQTMHQFLATGLVVLNPDEPSRPINSGKTVYQVEASALKLLRTYGTAAWPQNLKAYLASIETLKKRYAQAREMARIPITVQGKVITLSPGGQNVLVEKILDEFASRFLHDGVPLYIGDTDAKFAYFNEAGLTALGVTVDPHGKMPDIIIHHVKKNWLVLIEAVTSHGPINPKRQAELKALFAGSRAGIVYVTAFLSRQAMAQYLPEISWETEVWVADAPDHLIHFNGERFLGPY